MLKNTQQLRGRRDGFTIIEVLIVLAIAGLIMVVVFLAIPNLQRSQRNQARKTDANNILSAVSDYMSNNGGSPPSASCANAGTGSGQCPFLSNVNLGYFLAANVSYVTPFPSTAPTTANNPDSNHVIVYSGGTCSAGATQPPAASTAPRALAIWYGIEGSVSTQCVSE